MNELREVLVVCLAAQSEPGKSDPQLDQMLDDRIEAIESRLIALGECRAEMLAVLAQARCG
jgi:hypothetical protein